ncbi:hypothetical protein JW964_25130, partial [candidate division KSB1 bacterium]|nr:hypothetical protein [candidate division KSB1 bacterium]
ALKQKKAPPPRPAVKRTPPSAKIEKTESVEDILKRELSEMFGLPEKQVKKEVQAKKIPPKVQARPMMSIESQQRSEAFARPGIPSLKMMAEPKKEKLSIDSELNKELVPDAPVLSETETFQERLVWAEILGPPKALRRKHRVI